VFFIWRIVEPGRENALKFVAASLRLSGKFFHLQLINPLEKVVLPQKILFRIPVF